MKYFTVLLTFFIMLSANSLASDASINQDLNSSSRQKFKEYFINNVLPNKLAYHDTDDIKARVITTKKIEWEKYNDFKYIKEHEAALTWLQSLRTGKKYKELHNLANQYNDFIHVTNPATENEVNYWLASVNNYKNELNLSRTAGKFLRVHKVWYAKDLNFISDVFVKHDTLLTHLITAYINVRESLKEELTNRALEKYDDYMIIQQKAMSISSKNS